MAELADAAASLCAPMKVHASKLLPSWVCGSESHYGQLYFLKVKRYGFTILSGICHSPRLLIYGGRQFPSALHTPVLSLWRS